MKNYLFVIFFSLFTLHTFAQQRGRALEGSGTDSEENAVQDSVAKPPVQDYKIISYENDTTFVDTSLTIQKDYKFNYLRKDNFELLPFNNTGQPYTHLSYEVEFDETMPDFGARARHFRFFEVEDISYYRVPTPFTELYFKTVPEQGQQLDAFFTVNTSPNFNFSVAYNGVRALGKYQHYLTSTGIFRTTANYHTSNKKYQLRTHFVTHDLTNEENGGLTEQALEQYIGEEEEFDDRSLLDVRFENAENTLNGKRFYLEHEYFLTNPITDSLNSLSFGHVFNFNYKKYTFNQTQAEKEVFGESFESSNLRDQVRLEEVYNEANVTFKNNILGRLKARAAYKHFDYGYNSVYVLEDGEVITNKLNGGTLSIGGEYQKNIGGFNLDAEASLNVVGEFSGNYLMATASYALDEDNQIAFGLNQSSMAPNYNFLLYQSDYINYNWQNDYDNINSQNLHFRLNSKKLFQAEANLTQIQNYTYFGLNEGAAQVKPFQYAGQVRYYRIKAEREFDFGRFGMYHTLMYQNVVDGTDALKLPDFVTRNSIYYKDFWFDKALYLQTGFTFKYFSPYQINGYDPVLAEFYVQDEQELGGYPVLDFFFNGKVRQTRIFFKLENVNSLLTGNNNFSAPGYPYTDFLVRFGLVWNFFI
ncbi:putative porin [Zunongwangia sp. F363]|uniref:Porin n=1 Tax=Autumnicola tepida TaxID=3075595 RepID=A0ABU3CBB6_9FLAO|nr:putative porin [Zunongwangia sp. F363]MDT0643631.1 putative porin [Zunongwangia sp. F363]